MRGIGNQLRQRVRLLLSTLERYLLQAAEVTARPANESPDAESKAYDYGRIALFIALIAGAGLVFGPVLARRWNEITTSPITVPFPKDRWKLIPPRPQGESLEKACAGAVVRVDCPAHPKNPAAAESRFSRADRKHAELVRSFGDRPFWLVYDLHKDEAQLASKSLANHLFIGLINGKYKIYINGILVRESPHEPERGLVSASIPLEWLNRGLRIAVWIQNDSQSAFPDVFESSYLRSTGLTNSDTLDGMFSLRNFIDENRHLILASIYFLMSGFFFSLWVATPRKRELFFFSIFGLTLGLLSLRLATSFYRGIPRFRGYQLELLLRYCEGVAVLCVGFAMARIRRDAVMLAAFSAVFTFCLSFMTAGSGPQYLQQSTWVAIYIVPPCYLGASLACLLQWGWVRNQIRRRKAYWLQARSARLAGFTVIFACLGGIYFWQARHFSDPGVLLSVHRYTPLLAFLSGAFILFKEFRDQSQQSDYTPISKFHRLQPLPGKVHGLILDIDLKKSEVLYRAATDSSDQNMLVFPFVDSWITISRSIGGEVIQFQGDMIRVLFETPSDQVESISARLMDITQAVRRMDALMDEIAKDLEQRTGIPVHHLVRRPAFRACLSLGSIRPMLVGQGPQKMATWMNSDESHVLMRVARLAEAEKVLMKSSLQASDGMPVSTLILDEETIPGQAMQRVWTMLRSHEAEVRCGIQSYLEEKNSSPPQLTLICWQKRAGSPNLQLRSA